MKRFGQIRPIGIDSGGGRSGEDRKLMTKGIVGLPRFHTHIKLLEGCLLTPLAVP